MGKSRPPWITREVRRSCRLRDRARGLAKLRNTAECWEKFRSLRNRAVAAIRGAKKAFFNSLSSSVRSLKDFWKAFDYQCTHFAVYTVEWVGASMLGGGEGQHAQQVLFLMLRSSNP